MLVYLTADTRRRTQTREKIRCQILISDYNLIPENIFDGNDQWLKVKGGLRPLEVRGWRREEVGIGNAESKNRRNVKG